MTTVNKYLKTPLAQAGLLLLLLVAWLIPHLIYIQLTPFEYDEGPLLMFGTLAALGHKPYAETFVGHPPLAVLTLQLGAMFFGHTPGVRYPMLLYSLIGAVAVFWAVKYQTTDRSIWTGLLAAIFLSFELRYFSASSSLQLDVPAVAFALLAIAFIEAYCSRLWSGWLVLSGVAFALSLALKILVIFLPLVVGLRLLIEVIFHEKAALSQKQTYIRLAQMGAIWFSGALIVFCFFLFIYSPEAMYRQVILFRTTVRAVILTTEGSQIQQNLLLVSQAIIHEYALLAILALLGLLLRRNQASIWLWPFWFVLAALLLFVHVPARERYTVILLPPLVVLSSMALTSLVSQSPPYLGQRRWLKILAVGIAVGWFLFNLFGIVALLSKNTYRNLLRPEFLAAVTFIQQTTAPNDCVIVDDQRFSFETDRLVPPYLSETSDSRLSIGWLTAEEIIKESDKYNCTALVFIIDRFDRFVPDLHQAAKSRYSLRLDFGDLENADVDIFTIYAIRMDTTEKPRQFINRSLGGKVILQGIDMTPSPWRGGQTVTISTYWLTRQEMDRDYKIFLHFKDSQGHLVATFDHYPFEFTSAYLLAIMPHDQYRQGQVIEDFTNYPATGLIPTRLWVPGNTLKETKIITWPAILPTGRYTVEIGLYDPVTLERLPVDHEPGSSENTTSQLMIQVVE